MWPPFTFVVLLAGVCLNLNVLQAAQDDVGNANDFVDEVLQNLRNESSLISQLDPLKIPDVTENKFELKDCIIRGLSSLYRHGDCTIEYENDTITVACEVAVRNVTADADYAAKVLFFWIKGRVDADLDHLALDLKISSTNGKVRLVSLKVVDLGDYKIKNITGMTVVLNWLLKLIANSIARKSRGEIINAIEGPAAEALGKELEKIKFPDFS